MTSDATHIDPDLEIRDFPVEGLSYRDEGEGIVAGLAVPYGRVSEDLGGFVEKVAQGAASASLKENDVVMLWQHNPENPVTRMSASEHPLRLTEKPSGVYFEVDARVFREDQLDLIRRGVVKQMSFGFRTLEDVWDEDRKPILRTLNAIDVREISPVTWPAYRSTKVAVRCARAAGVNLKALWESEGDVGAQAEEKKLRAWIRQQELHLRSLQV